MYETPNIGEQHRNARNLRLPKVIHRTGLSRATIYALMKKGEFPASHKIRENCTEVAWFDDEIDEYVERMRTTPSAPPRKIVVTDSTDIQTTAARSLPGKGEKPKPHVLPNSKTKPLPRESGFVLTTFKVKNHEGEIYMQKGTGMLFGVIGQVPPEVLSLYFPGEFDRETGTDQ